MNALIKPFSKTIEEFLEDLAAELEVPQERYEAAERSYKSVGEWLQRDESFLKHLSPNTSVQGSFRLGTVIRPVNETEDYDVDAVCELSADRSRYTQEQLKNVLGIELAAYAKAKAMNNRPEEKRRCWRLDYADGAQFHIDVLPAVPDAARQKALFEEAGLNTAWWRTAVAITCKDHRNYSRISDDWSRSNPKGYAEWFISRMAAVYRERLRKLAEAVHAKVEDIPTYRVKTPLQSAIQILKRHRDLQFLGDIEHRPISVIITTLAAHAYQQEKTISGALYSILMRMDQFIEDRGGVMWIVNPTDPMENFADRWLENPKLQDAFFAWLEQARADFRRVALMTDRREISESLARHMGTDLVEKSFHRRTPALAPNALLEATAQLFGRFNVWWRQKPEWPQLVSGRVAIVRATMTRSGFRPTDFRSGETIPKLAALTFEAKTDVRVPYRVYWQVVNTGMEAEAANSRRGEIFEGTLERGKLTRQESSLYRGDHTIECFIVKDGWLVARSGPMVVSIS
jgi:hypothetical protein